jgi:gas vesicle protein
MTTHDDSRITYFILGIGLGLLGGLLLAPRSGEEIREDVRRRTNEGLDYLNQRAERLRERTQEAVKKTKGWVRREGSDGEPTAAEAASPFAEEKPIS